ncbi:MAG: hypothetical protein R3A45_02435 [Bdellovibrionota bacterium]
MPFFLDELDRMLSENTILFSRWQNLAITTKDAIAYGLVGPNLRATGLHYDLRKDQPYACYNELDFEVPVGKGEQVSWVTVMILYCSCRRNEA